MGAQTERDCLDTWAVLAYLADEGAGERVADIIATAMRKARL